MIAFLASQTGRWLRIVVGLALIVYGFMAATTIGYVLAAVGLVPFLAGVFDVCVLAPLFGHPVSGAKIRAHVHA